MELFNPPYYAVIFTSRQSKDLKGYPEMAEKMEQLAKEQPGYLGFESARTEIGIAVSYWKDQESIKNWKLNLDHQLAQRIGQEQWYSEYTVRISKVEREYRFISS